MIRRRDFLGLASVITIGLMVTSCDSESAAVDTSKSRTGAMDSFGVGDTFKATAPLTFSCLFSDMPSYAYKKDWLFFTKLAADTNVTLDATVVPSSDYEQKRSLLISSGNAPEIIAKTYPGQESAFVSSGAVLPVSDYVDLMPNFQDKVKKWKLEPEIEGLTQADGKYYVLPGLHEELWPDYTLAVRTDIFEKNNIAIPKTWDEFREALRKLKKAYPDVVPFSDRFNGNAVLNIAGTAFGTVSGWGLVDGLVFDESAKKFSFGAGSGEFKALITYFNSLVSEGLMDPESFTQPDDSAVQKFVTGKSFVISTNSQNIVTYRTSMEQSLGKGNFAISKITVPGGPAGDVIGGSRLENGIMLNSSVADKDNFVALIQFIDWLFYSDAGQEYSKWGVKGTTYDVVNGKRTPAPDVNFLGLNPKGTKDLRVDYGFSGGNFAYGGTTDLLQSTMNEEELKFQKDMQSKTPKAVAPPVPFSDTDREQATLVLTPLKDHVKQNTLKFITGQRPLGEFDAYVKELDAKGQSKYVELANKAYKAYAEKK
ncbi:putative aldouronate transport system substrate-binding protein [Arthrobacter pascens]|uniref:ABC transporter substrate-binding protein n=1 Tax=Arthrobacter pascens TaxID=1677 RepID=UPI00279416C0|nr:extracellular solute-binding protein [Arthrobacter pascens]MDQ0679837.1 putative aldouronate transport system substrate-binding protein [Arthrobacter pascens]